MSDVTLVTWLITFGVALLVAGFIGFRNNKRMKLEQCRIDKFKPESISVEKHCAKHNYTVPKGALPYCPKCTRENELAEDYSQFSMVAQCPQCGHVDNHPWLNAQIYDDEIEPIAYSVMRGFGLNNKVYDLGQLTRDQLLDHLLHRGIQPQQDSSKLDLAQLLLKTIGETEGPIESVMTGGFKHSIAVVRECVKCSYSWKQS